MGLRQQQDALAKLYTDAALRSQFGTEPHRVGTAHGLSREETDELSTVLPTAVAEYAAALLSKRQRAVEKLIPRTRRKLGPNFPQRFHDYTANDGLGPAKKHYHDAVAFCSYLARHASQAGRDAAAAARFEKARLEFFHGNKRLAATRTGELSAHDAGKPILALPFTAGRGVGVAIWIRFLGRTWYIRL